MGLIGNAISWQNATAYSLLVIVISLVMINLALQMLGVSWARKFAFRLPKFIIRYAADETRFRGRYMPFTIGAATFFLPCGFTLMAQGVALTTGSFWGGAFIMFFFALGTLPMLAAISLTGLKFTSRPHLTARFGSVAGVIILFFALYNINGQLNVLGYPSLSDMSLARAKSKTKVVMPADGRIWQDQLIPVSNPTQTQMVYLTAKDFDYFPIGPLTIKADRPTKLVVDNQGIQGCGSYLAARGLLNGYVPLQLGQNIIDLGRPKPGNYKITCAMGMVPPVTLTVK